MDGLLKNEAFATGITVGVNLYEQKIITAHQRKEPLKIGNNTLYYIQDGRERLAEIIEKMCK